MFWQNVFTVITIWKNFSAFGRMFSIRDNSAGAALLSIRIAWLIVDLQIDSLFQEDFTVCIWDDFSACFCENVLS